MIEDEPKFTPGPWRRTITTVPNVTEGYDTSPDIVNLTIGDRNIPLAVRGMNSTAEMRLFFNEMVANAALIAQSPTMYAELDGTANFLRALADELEETMKHDSRREYAENVLRLAKCMAERADRIDALLKKAREEAK